MRPVEYNSLQSRLNVAICLVALVLAAAAATTGCLADLVVPAEVQQQLAASSEPAYEQQKLQNFQLQEDTLQQSGLQQLLPGQQQQSDLPQLLPGQQQQLAHLDLQQQQLGQLDLQQQLLDQVEQQQTVEQQSGELKQSALTPLSSVMQQQSVQSPSVEVQQQATEGAQLEGQQQAAAGEQSLREQLGARVTELFGDLAPGEERTTILDDDQDAAFDNGATSSTRLFKKILPDGREAFYKVVDERLDDDDDEQEQEQEPKSSEQEQAQPQPQQQQREEEKEPLRPPKEAESPASVVEPAPAVPETPAAAAPTDVVPTPAPAVEQPEVKQEPTAAPSSGGGLLSLLNPINFFINNQPSGADASKLADPSQQAEDSAVPPNVIINGVGNKRVKTVNNFEENNTKASPKSGDVVIENSGNSDVETINNRSINNIEQGENDVDQSESNGGSQENKKKKKKKNKKNKNKDRDNGEGQSEELAIEAEEEVTDSAEDGGSSGPSSDEPKSRSRSKSKSKKNKNKNKSNADANAYADADADDDSENSQQITDDIQLRQQEQSYLNSQQPAQANLQSQLQQASGAGLLANQGGIGAQGSAMGDALGVQDAPGTSAGLGALGTQSTISLAGQPPNGVILNQMPGQQQIILPQQQPLVMAQPGASLQTVVVPAQPPQTIVVPGQQSVMVEEEEQPRGKWVKRRVRVRNGKVHRGHWH